MYKILLADDEPEVLEGLKIVIDWEKYGFEIAQTAVNGRDALNKLKEGKFHLVITDIRMPALDGLELIEAIQGIDSHMKILILSGFNEFKYAKRAIELGVKGYLLKPVDQEELIGQLEGIRREIDDAIKSKIAIRQYSEMAKDKLLMDLTNGNLPGARMEEQAAQYGMNISYKHFCCALLEIEDFRMMAENDLEDANLFKFAVRNITGEIVSARGPGYVYDEQQDKLGIIFCGDTIESGTVESAIKEICQCIRRILNLKISVGIGNVCSKLENIRLSMEQAEKALQRKYFTENDGIVIFSRLENNQKLVWQLNWDFTPLLSAIEVMNINTVNNEISKLMEEAERKHVSKELIQAFSLNLALGLNTIIAKYKGDSRELYNERQLEVLTNGCSNLRQFGTWLAEVCEKVVSYLSELSGIKSVKIIDQIKKYIDEHYFEDISLRSIASVFYLNTAYLGQLFKNTLGLSFSDYLNRKRIEEVKKMILIDNYKACDAIIKAGYNNTEYFYRQFKRYENISFAEYKGRIKES